MKKDEILEHWDRVAAEFGSRCTATLPDILLKYLELRSIVRHLRAGDTLFDIGCGNGYSSFHFAETVGCPIVAADYSEKMISAARAEQKIRNVRGIRFEVADVLNLVGYEDCFDIVLSERCLINLTSWEDQKQAIDGIRRCLKPGGLYIMSEGFTEPLARLNDLRKVIGLPPIIEKWHNIYLNEARVLEFMNQKMDILKIDPYSSTYYFLTRAVSPGLGKMEGRETGYDDSINHIGFQLPAIGDFGPQKTIVFCRRE